MNNPDIRSHSHLAREFATTHWSVILEAGGGASEQADAALDQLCRSYWYPLYAYVRRQGHDAHDAQDLTQGFFARFLERKHVLLADPERGKFRTFLLCSLKHFLIGEWEKSSAVKRGGEHAIFSWDEKTAEGRYLAEPVDGLTPERIYEKRWAVTVLEKVLGRLREKYVAGEKAELFDALKPYVWGDKMVEGEMVARLGMTEGAVRVAMHRLRENYRELLRNEVAGTVATLAEVDEELRHLAAALRT
jgi:DNA-directed RNA polymerase specialized sigma24 family protein